MPSPSGDAVPVRAANVQQERKEFVLGMMADLNKKVDAMKARNVNSLGAGPNQANTEIGAT